MAELIYAPLLFGMTLTNMFMAYVTCGSSLAPRNLTSETPRDLTSEIAFGAMAYDLARCRLRRIKDQVTASKINPQERRADIC